MKKARIDIVEIDSQLRAIIQIGYNPQPLPNKRIIFQRIEEIKEGESLVRVRQAIEKLKARARKWLRRVRKWAPEERIDYVANLDPESYYR